MFPFSRVLAEIENSVSDKSNHPAPAAWRHLAYAIIDGESGEIGRSRSSDSREAAAYADAAGQASRHGASDPESEQLPDAEFAAFLLELTRVKNSVDELRKLRRRVARSFHPDTSRYGAAAAGRLGEFNALIDAAICQRLRQSSNKSA